MVIIARSNSVGISRTVENASTSPIFSAFLFTAYNFPVYPSFLQLSITANPKPPLAEAPTTAIDFGLINALIFLSCRSLSSSHVLILYPFWTTFPLYTICFFSSYAKLPSARSKRTLAVISLDWTFISLSVFFLRSSNDSDAS